MSSLRHPVLESEQAPPPVGDNGRPRRRLSQVPTLPLPLWLLLPAIVLVALVSAIPAAYAIRLSLFDTEYLRVGEYVGLDNFRQVLADRQALADIARTLVYVLGSLVIVVPFSLGLGLLLNRRFRFRRLFRILLFLPWVISQTIAALIWRWLLDPGYGPLPLGSIDLLSSAETAMLSLIVVNVWMSYPLATILQLAALQAIPAEIYESSSVDGAGPWQRIWHITIPLIRPTMLVAVILLTLLYFNMVTLVYTFTGGGPFSGTQVVALRAFEQSFLHFNIDAGAAYSVVLFVFNVIFATAYVKVLKSDV